MGNPSEENDDCLALRGSYVRVGGVGRAAAVIDDGDPGRAEIGSDVLDVLTGEQATALLVEAGFNTP